jgi:hypothetical protein
MGSGTGWIGFETYLINIPGTPKSLQNFIGLGMFGKDRQHAQFAFDDMF